ncbi:MAG: glycosyltransferase [Bacteroidetes bacterium]|nr:glycosyltransferase [Bacteroidota bacterium]
MNIFSLLLFIIALAYSFLILLYAYYFKKINYNQLNYQFDKFVNVSIIIPARNESHCILELMQSIKNQTYPYQFIEIIVVDDASTDDTFKVVQDFANQNSNLNCKVIRIEDNTVKKTYKKFAISKAIQLSKGDLIITTDADCVVGCDWVAGIVNLYIQSNAKMIVGFVAYSNDDSIFQKMQNLEFLSLIASGVSAVESGYPIMCNGANLVYERKAFDEVNGFDLNEHFASGDDVFLLLKIKKHFGKNSIFVLDDKNTIVYTHAMKNLSAFIQQRIRWASKTKGYKDLSILLVAGIVFSYNTSIIFTLLIGIVYHNFLLITLYLFLLKVVIDFPIILSITKFVNRKDLLIFYLPLQILYLPYILIIGIISNFISYQWKGRTIKD